MMKYKIRINKIVFTTPEGIKESYGLFVNGKPSGEFNYNDLIDKIEKIKRGYECGESRYN